jgi:mannose-6-phosphate isomerase-like protein (cupin superfamily)
MSDSTTAMSSSSVTARAEPTMLVIPPEGGRPVAAFGSVAVFKLEGTQTGGAFSLFLAETPPGAGPPLHVHHHEDELFLVQQGEITFQTPTGSVETTPGTVVYLPGGVPHAFRNTGTEPSRHWALTFPSGFENFYTRAAQLFASGAANPERLQSLAREYGYQFLAPASSPPAGGS